MRRAHGRVFVIFGAILLLLAAGAVAQVAKPEAPAVKPGVQAAKPELQVDKPEPVPPKVYWLNHLDFLPGDVSVKTAFNAVTSGVGSGLAGLIVTSTTTGETAAGGGNKVVEMAVEAPLGQRIAGVRVCYEYSTGKKPSPTYISQIRLAQVQNPPSTALVLLDDGTDQTHPGPICVNSKPAVDIDPAKGPLLLSLRVNFADTKDKIVIRGVGLILK
jgi:hypothetical protein